MKRTLTAAASALVCLIVGCSDDALDAFDAGIDASFQTTEVWPDALPDVPSDTPGGDSQNDPGSSGDTPGDAPGSSDTDADTPANGPDEGPSDVPGSLDGGGDEGPSEVLDGVASDDADGVVGDGSSGDDADGAGGCEGQPEPCPTPADPCTIATASFDPETCETLCTESQLPPDLDSDGDTLPDCDELTDDNPATDPLWFNGLTAIIGEKPTGFFTSAQCNLFFGDNFGEMYALFDESGQSHNIYGGWNYQAGNTNDYAGGDYDFQPPFASSNQTGIHNSFQILMRGEIWLAEAGTWCFSVDTGAGGFGPGDIAGRRNSCGRIYFDANDSSGPIAETGYGSSESPNVACVEADAGPHTLDLAARHYEAHFYGPKYQVRWCFGAGCTPDKALEQGMLTAKDGCAPQCQGKECGDDGCGGDCGPCPGEGAWCGDDFQCVTPCVPACEGKDCGDDGCGGSCGDCGDQVCSPDFQCVDCVPSCALPGGGEKECGDDGCGAPCGTCGKGFGCEAGLCVEVCVPECDGKNCGGDGCGGTCGACLNGTECVDGLCTELAPSGACTNSADQAVITTLGPSGLQDEIDACGTPCVVSGAPDKGVCVAECLVTAVGLSAGCADCFGEVHGCVLDHCAVACITQDADCVACKSANGCEDGFAECSGL